MLLTLQKKLMYYGQQCTIVGQRHAQQIRLMVEAGHLKLIMTEGEVGPFNDRASTGNYEGCILVHIDKTEELTMEVFHGDNQGNPTYLEGVYHFTGAWWLYQPLVEVVEAGFKRKTDLELREIERLEREKRRRAYADRRLQEMGD